MDALLLWRQLDEKLSVMSDEINRRLDALEGAVRSLAQLVMAFTDQEDHHAIAAQIEEQQQRVEEMRLKADERRRRADDRSRRIEELRNEASEALAAIPQAEST